MQSSIYTNIAFISYKHEDEEWAKWLQKKLEHYKLPSEIRKQYPNLEFAKNPRHVFKDTTDLSGGVLAKAIKAGLDSSKYLIVICSPRAAQSEWVCKEVQDFIVSGREEYIIPFIIEGEPYAIIPDKECFPESLKTLAGERELLGININENGRESAVVKVLSRIFDLRFDTLWNRFLREQKKRRRYTIASLIATILVVAGIAGFVWTQNQELDKRNHLIKKQFEELQTKNAQIEQQNKELDAKSDSIQSANDSIQKAYEKLDLSERNLAKTNAALKKTNIRLAEERDNVIRANWKMMESQSRAVCEKAMELIKGGDVYRALYILKEIYPIKGNRPWIPEIDAVAYAAYDSLVYGNGCSSQMKKHFGEVIGADLQDNMLVTTSNDCTVRFWNIETGAENIDYRITINDAVYEVSISPDKKWVVFPTGGYGSDGQLYLYKKNGEKYVFDRKLGKGDNPVFLNNNRLTAYTYIDTSYVYTEWDTEKWQPIYREDEKKYYFNNSGELMFVVQEEGKHKHEWEYAEGEDKSDYKTTIFLKNVFSNRILHSYSINGHPYTICGFSNNSKYAYIATSDILAVVEIESGSIIKTIEDCEYDCTSFSNKGDYLCFVQRSQPLELHFLSLKNHNLIGEDPIALKSKPRKVLISDDDKYLLCMSEDGITYKYNAPFSKEEYQVSRKYSYDSVQSVKLSSNMRYKLELLTSDRLIITDTYTNKKRTLVSKNSFGDFNISNDGKYVVSVGYLDTKVTIWDVDKQKVINEKFLHSNHIWCVAFSNDGQLIVTGDRDNMVNVWNFNTGLKVCSLFGHVNGVTGVQFYDNDSKIISESYDCTVRFWDWRRGIEYTEKRIVHGASLLSNAINYEQRFVSTADKNNVYIWNYDSGALVRKISIAGTTEQWWDNNVLFLLNSDEPRNNTGKKFINYIIMPDIENFLINHFKTLDTYFLSEEEKRQFYLK